MTSMIRKSAQRFSDKIMLKHEARARCELRIALDHRAGASPARSHLAINERS